MQAAGVEAAGVAVRLACLAGVAAVEDEPVVGFGEECGRDVAHQFTLGLQGGLGVAGEADAVGHAEDVGVHRHGGQVEGHGGDHVGRLAPHAGQPLQLLQRVGHLALELVHQHPRQGRQVLALVVGVGYGVDVPEEVLRAGGGHGLRGGVGVEEGGGDHVHPLVRTLRRKHHRHQQLEHTAVVQLRPGSGHGALEVVQRLAVALFPGHGVAGSSETMTG